ncbi:MAG: ABC transporter permease [Candidatus Thermoplasmatota archaeon]|nr:ABC transporter permease [Candidatus Thermoplasmatota archaeon]
METAERSALMDGLRALRSSIIFGRKGSIIWDSWEMWMLQIFILPLTQMAFFAFLAGSINHSASDVQYVVIGNAIQTMSFSAVFSVANITSQDKWQGTLTGIIVSPANRMALLVGRASFQIVMSTMISAIGLVYAHFLFGVSFYGADFTGVILILVITSVTMMGFGLLISSIGLYLRTAMIMANVFLFISLLVCGVNFPIYYLPSWLRVLSYVIPMTYGVSAMRLAISGSSIPELSGIIFTEISVGIIVILVAYVLMKLFEYLARKTGRLEQY